MKRSDNHSVINGKPHSESGRKKPQARENFPSIDINLEQVTNNLFSRLDYRESNSILEFNVINKAGT